MVRKWANQQVAGKGRFSCNSWRTCALFRRLYPMALVVQQVVTFTASLAALWLVCPWRPTFAIFWTSGREILRFMFHTTPGGLIGMINQSCDTMLVAYFFGPASTGILQRGQAFEAFSSTCSGSSDQRDYHANISRLCHIAKSITSQIFWHVRLTPLRRLYATFAAPMP